MIRCPNPANRLEPLLKGSTELKILTPSFLQLKATTATKLITILQLLSLQVLVAPSRNAMILFVTYK